MSSPPPRTWATVTLVLFAALARPDLAAASGPQGGPGCAGLQAEVEPNDAPATASPIAFGFSGVFVGIYGTIATPGDVDWYSFSATAGGRLWLSVDTGVAGPGGSRDSAVEVFASDGVTLIESDDDDGTGNARDFTIESVDTSLVAGAVLPVTGTYYARVRAQDPGQTIEGYSLLIAVINLAPGGEGEPNDCLPDQPPPFLPPTSAVILGSLSSPTDSDCYLATLLDSGFPLVVVDADPERDGVATDVTLRYFNTAGLPSIVTDSSGTGGPSNPPSEGFAIQWNLGVVRVSGTGPGTYMLAVVYSGECLVPVELQAFEVE